MHGQQNIKKNTNTIMYKNTLNRTTTKGRINKNVTNVFFFRGATAPSGPGPPQYRGFRIILRRTTLGRTPLDERQARRRDLYLTTHNPNKRQTSMPPGKIRTCNPSKRTAVDPRLRHARPLGPAGN